MPEVYTFMSPFLFRGIERLMIILFGGLCVYWGYRLFDLALSSEGQLRAEGKGFKFELKQVAPGVFFALFGAVVLCTGLFNPISISRTNSNESDQSPLSASSQSSLIWGNFPVTGDAERTKLTETIFAINRVLHYCEMKPPTDLKEKNDLELNANLLRSHRSYLVDRVEGKDSTTKYATWAIEKEKNPSSFDKQQFPLGQQCGRP